MDGAELLERVKKEFPDTIRFALSGQSDQETWMRSLGSAHQFLSKPCNRRSCAI
jgi:response regulator RpfG family c-di-GMP phosphodiesterase